MQTYNRQAFVPRAIEYFLRQNHAEKDWSSLTKVLTQLVSEYKWKERCVPRLATITTSQLGLGQLGTYGSLVYEGKSVQVRRQQYKHALSTHPTARLAFNLGWRFVRLCCQVAFKDNVRSTSPGASNHAAAF